MEKITMNRNPNPLVSMFSAIGRTRKISRNQMILWTLIIVAVVVLALYKPMNLDIIVHLTVK
jgi:hypothetical protein